MCLASPRAANEQNVLTIVQARAGSKFLHPSQGQPGLLREFKFIQGLPPRQLCLSEEPFGASACAFLPFCLGELVEVFHVPKLLLLGAFSKVVIVPGEGWQ